MSAGATASRVGALEQRYLGATFAELCRIESPSRHERACAQYVVAQLRDLGVTVEEDGAAVATGSDCGNLIARIPARAELGDSSGGPSVMLCAHLDTVPLHAPIEPVLRDGFWENANDGILGADNKAAIVVLLALARHVAREGAPVDLELLFTVGEETALAGSRALDAGSLRSTFGYAFDHASPIGEVVMDSPTHYALRADFRGAAAHAGIQPELGRSAILAAARAVCALQLGRLDEHATVNIGTVDGGTAMNVVPERCTLVGEVRALGDERAEELVAEVVDRINEAANHADCDCDVDISVERSFSGYELSTRSAPLLVAEAALRACGHEPRRISSGGGSDANALIAAGFQAVNLANGTERPHEPGERVAAAALEQMLDVALALVEQTAALAQGAAQ